MERTLVVATRNSNKVRELAAMLEGLPVRLETPDAYPGLREIEETGSTFEENATLKAVATAALTGQVALADDSGLEVDALGGRPGLYSARYAGIGAGDEANRRKLLEELEAVPEARRGAKFVCVVAVASPRGACRLFRGECEGRILMEERGGGGFGYDPLFLVEALGRSMAELESEEKNRISHRAKALEAARGDLIEWAAGRDF